MKCWPDEYIPLNGCTACCLDFASLDAFDRHRIGRHEPMERRCLTLDELAEVGLRPLAGEEQASARYATRAALGVVIVCDPAAADRARRRFAG